MTPEREISPDQRARLEEKVHELRRLHETLESASPEERHSAMEAKHDELSPWAAASGIPQELLPTPGGSGRRSPDELS